MSTQLVAALISFAGIAVMIAVYWFVWSSSGSEEPYDEVRNRAYRVRGRLFAGLLVFSIAVSAFTLRSLPYSIAAGLERPTVVDVAGAQWNWTLSRDEVPVDSPIVFRVASADVNHGFAIYDPSGRLIAQVQVMPGYVNELAVRFEEPGSYKIRCLEYCGLAHHVMAATIEVVPTADATRGEV